MSHCSTYNGQDLSSNDIADLYIVCRVIRVGRMVYDEKANAPTTQDYRRPYAGTILDKSMAALKDINAGEQEHVMPLYQCQEASFPQLPENVLNKKPNTYDRIEKAKGVCLSLRLLHGEITSLSQELGFLLDVPRVQKLGFPDIILPGETRNDLYMTLITGDFSQDRKASKNVQLTLCVLDKKGTMMKDVVLQGHGGLKSVVVGDTFESTIFYHTNSPKWQELVQLRIPVR